MRIQRHILLSFLSMAFAWGNLSAQNHDPGFQDPGHLTCDQHDMTQKFFADHPELVAPAESATAELEAFTQAYESSAFRSDDVQIIPVVFHVVHLDGVENISDAQIQSAIDVLNEDYSAMTPELSGVVPAFAGIVGDVGFEFRLARRDPDGNCTNGINRVYSDETLDGSSNSLKQQIPSWGRSKYLNVWVVKNIGSGAAGFAYLPGTVSDSFWGAKNDGIVILHNYVGRTGTSNQSRSHALSHEVGHWANLAHTWGGSNTPGDPANCQMDDGVSDTPTTIGWQTCNLSGQTCGSLDNVQNFMDYSYCYCMFTEGQKMRMKAAINSGTAQRNNLHSDGNLIETGVLEEDEICLADFTTTQNPEICAGSFLQFEDLSYHNPTEWFWTFEGGDPVVSEVQNPVVTYTEPGIYNVSLTVSTEIDGETITKDGFVTVLPEGMAALPYTESFETIAALDGSEGWLDYNPDGGQNYWKINNEVGYSDDFSVYVRGRYNLDNAVEVLTSPTYDLSGLTQQPLVTFKYAYKRRSASTQDRLRVYISSNCGDSWVLRENIGMDNLPTVEGNEFYEFVPTSPDQWQEVQVGYVVSSFFTDKFRLKFEFTSYKGNNIYIDDINISGVTDVNEATELRDLKLYPNPTRGLATLELDLNQPTSLNIDLLDITGRQVRNVLSELHASGRREIAVSTGDLAVGMYMLRIQTDLGIRTERLIIE